MADPIEEDIRISRRKKLLLQYQNIAEANQESNQEVSSESVGNMQGKKVKDITSKNPESYIRHVFDKKMK